MDDVTIRAACPRDADVVEHYHHRCFLNSYAEQLSAGEFHAPDRDGTRTQLLGWFQPGSDFPTWVATIDDQPVAHFTLHQQHLVHLFVAPERHGTGLGRYLLARAEATLAAGGHSDIELHTRVENERAIAFYTKAGWVMTGQRITTVEHGISYDEHIMRKQLS